MGGAPLGGCIPKKQEKLYRNLTKTDTGGQHIAFERISFKELGKNGFELFTKNTGLCETEKVKYKV